MENLFLTTVWNGESVLSYRRVRTWIIHTVKPESSMKIASTVNNCFENPSYRLPTSTNQNLENWETRTIVSPDCFADLHFSSESDAWHNPENWESSTSDGTLLGPQDILDIEKIPCDFDDANFPSSNSFTVEIEWDTALRSLRVADKVSVIWWEKMVDWISRWFLMSPLLMYWDSSGIFVACNGGRLALGLTLFSLIPVSRKPSLFWGLSAQYTRTDALWAWRYETHACTHAYTYTRSPSYWLLLFSWNSP